MSNSKRITTFFITSGLLTSTIALAAEPLAEVVIDNPTNFQRIDEVVTLRLVDLGIEVGDPAVDEIVAKMDGDPIRVQAWDANGDGAEESLSLLLDLEKSGTKTVELEVETDSLPKFAPRTQAEISHKVDGEWQGREYIGGHFENVQKMDTPPEHTDHSWYIRYEGPGWESDKVGYRFYLDWRNGFDIFGKLTDEMVLQGVGQDGFDSYHEESDWGMDILKVGSALGSGGYGLWVDGAAERISDTEGLSYEILENGPVLSQFRATYRGWQGSDQPKMDLVADLSIQAGSRVTWVRLETSEPAGPLCAGLVKHEGVEVITGDTDITGEAFTYLATWGPQSLDGSDLGMAILVRKKDLAKFAEDELNELAVFKKRVRGVDYGFLAAWAKEPNGITSRDEFVRYLDQLVERLTIAQRVDIYSELGRAEKAGELVAEKALYWTKRMGDSILARRGDTLAHEQYDPEANRFAKWSYTTGLISKAVHDLGVATGEESYLEWAENVISSYVSPYGEVATYSYESFNIDQINSGKMLLELFEMTGEDRYRVAADHLRKQLEEHPRTKNGAFWHKKRYPWQVWLDGVYMGIPFMVAYEQAFNDSKKVAEAVHEFVVCEEELRDPETGLYWHAWDESRQQIWADPETGRSQYFWGRGLGWFAMALVDTLEMLPVNSEESELLKPILQDLAAALVAVQDEEKGVWYQILDRPDAVGNYTESSASSMFTYMLAKGVNHGWLDERYGDAAKKAFSGMIKEFVRPHPDGTASLSHICLVAGLGFGRDGSYEYYMSEPVVENDPKGIGPFLMAGLEVTALLEEK
ncbi:glycoside hydrolase family 88 protein [Pelagicoccus albus]|uniref:Glycoside hydrolase family 88 protein n=1 Tax=Pelagicoccus albus TaxID=415222 RepID=A0A7X1B453_9BACT|nr:glycoside hydrolase family 88 protein [Pelagicoccus albus]MBC2605262.1 glycoside hydrolase family 88 protein [Pelagicoccus albus]